ncbi:12809_t:CDS:2 [Racocetra fulgida]|uniref:12809_t:CDS:1 n=1 Tax=Racocetra fulgida TaxID=60492 RepID=A0A9N8ZJQ2_9GLOM|nr:12809_t:CDS:2 [Racocetra fulgida]
MRGQYIETILPEHIPLGTISSETISPGTILPETISPGTILPGTISPGTISPETIPPGTLKHIPPENAASQDNKAYMNFMQCKRKVTFELGDKVVVAPNFDNNQKMRKHKLEQTCSITEKVVSVCSNNRTVRVDVNGEIKNFVAKNLKKLRK